MKAAPARARSFDAWASDYDRYRPDYPDALFDQIAARLMLPTAPHVADLGAGTGRATLAMAERGWHVTAVEPGRPMLDILRTRAADAGLLVATVQAPAEQTGLGPSTVDLATAAQAFHWFDAPAALAEMARVVRPGGGVALFWNVRDVDASRLLADYDALLGRFGVTADRHRAGPDPATGAAIRAAAAFGDPEFLQVRHMATMSPQAFIGLAFTSSYVRVLDADDQDRLADELAALVEREAGAAATLEVPYITDCWIAGRKDQ
jgi:SAM-dependent methyltransferase